MEHLESQLSTALAVASAPHTDVADQVENRNRLLVLDELVKTEALYISDLAALDEVLLAPLRNGAVFKAEKASKLFKIEEFEGMVRSSMQLLAALQKNPTIVKVCELFSTFIDNALASYSGYCSGK